MQQVVNNPQPHQLSYRYYSTKGDNCSSISIEVIFLTVVFNSRATNGNQTIDAPTEVVVLSPTVFDQTKTGVTKNASKTVILSCKAKGKPKPELSLRLYDEYGPDLTKSGLYKVR